MAKQIQDNTKFTNTRLPTTITPIHYDLCLKPDFNNFTFTGDVKINYQSTEVANNIVLHANELEIIDGSLESDSSSIALDTVYYSHETETATLEFKKNISTTGELHLKFRGILNDKLKGFYRTSFKIGQTTIYGAATQFGSTDARRCFPCWDEPAIKATFSVSMVVEKHLQVNGQIHERVVLSNMPEIGRSGPDEQIEIKFAKSPIMSTYLLAFVVGPFEALEGADIRRPIRVFTTIGKKEQGQFALEVATRALPYYEDYFDVKYPLAKMDLVAVPDFAFGAMENWGLVIYRETALLVDPTNTSTAIKQRIALIVAHELAHQWFGNLVTMEWWTHLWLNEGFASFMQTLCVDHIFPEWDIWSQFVMDAYSVALDLDSLHNSHPIEVAVKHVREIDEIFDVISYKKGASVIRMLYNYIGDDCFRKGMSHYLTKFSYKNAATEDLWDSLEAASNKPVRRLMSGWTSQKGFPWLSIAYSYDGHNEVKLTLTQNKFSADGRTLEEDQSSSWIIPISTRMGKDPMGTREMGLMEGKTKELSIDGAGDGWLKLNPGSIGLYRTAYPEEMMALLKQAILDQTLPPLDRLGIQNDFFALCQAGKVSSVELLKLLQAYRSETDYTVWKSIDSCMARLNVLLLNTDYRDLFHAFGRELYREIFNKLTWSQLVGEKHVDAMTRALVITRLVSLGKQSVVDEALRRYKAHVENKETIPADLRSAVYLAVGAYGDDATYSSLFELHKTTELQEEKNRIGAALGAAKQSDRLDKTINFTLSEEVRDQDKIIMIGHLAACNPVAGWKIMLDHKDMLREKYVCSFLMPRLVQSITENFADVQRAREIEEFFSENKFPGCERTVQQSLETIRLNAAWLARDNDGMRAFLSSLAN